MSNERKEVFALAATVVFIAATFAAAIHARSNVSSRGAREAAGTGRIPGASGYHISKTIPVGGEGFWDYAIVDPDARRLYVSHGTHVVVLDADAQAVVGDIPDTRAFMESPLRRNLDAGLSVTGARTTLRCSI
jgi:hypothetical protein